MIEPRQQIALVTGATGAIGKAIARGIAATPGYTVVLLGRDEARTRRATDEIRRETGNAHVSYELADVSRQAEIEALAGRWRDAQRPLHVLVNNAAATPRARRETPEGIEVQFATNVLGYVWMIAAFRDLLISAAPARVVNVASYYAGDLDLDDLQFERRPYDNRRAYRQSKQANRMLTVAYAEELAPYDVSVNACHPGDVNSKLSNNLGFGGSTSPADGARTPVWLATQPVGQEETGRYFEGKQARHDRFADDRAAIAALYEACQAFV